MEYGDRHDYRPQDRLAALQSQAQKVFGHPHTLHAWIRSQQTEWVFNKARDILHDYLEQAEDKLRKNGYLAKWERLVRDTVYDKTNFVDEWMFLPRKWKDKIHDLIANSVKDIVSKILRRTVPHFVEQWRIEHRIDEFDEQFNAEFLRKYWRKYVLKYMLYAFLAINFLIGITNLIWFLIIA
jgi:hypothetical protein